MNTPPPHPLDVFHQADRAYLDAQHELATLGAARDEALLRASKGMTVGDLAAATGLSSDQVRRMLARARRTAERSAD